MAPLLFNFALFLFLGEKCRNLASYYVNVLIKLYADVITKMNILFRVKSVAIS